MKPKCHRMFLKYCPEKEWNGEEGCRLWIEKPMFTKGGDKVVIKQCLDLWMFKLAWDANGLLEGNQQATESFRNGVVPGIQKINQLITKTDSAIVDCRTYKAIGE